MVIYLVEGLKWRERRAERGAGGYQHPRAQEARTRADRGARTGVDNENEPARDARDTCATATTAVQLYCTLQHSLSAVSLCTPDDSREETTVQTAGTV